MKKITDNETKSFIFYGLVLLLLFPGFAAAQVDFQARHDSLAKQITVLEGMDKLNAYAALCDLQFDY
jgi:hypothetical protein